MTKTPTKAPARRSSEVVWTGELRRLVFGAASQLRASAEVCISEDAKDALGAANEGKQRGAASGFTKDGTPDPEPRRRCPSTWIIGDLRLYAENSDPRLMMAAPRFLPTGPGAEPISRVEVAC